MSVQQGEVAAAAMPPRKSAARGPAIVRFRRWWAQFSSNLFLGILVALLVGAILILTARKGVGETSQQLINGVTQGAIFALIAVGYTMVYGIIELINFAHGDVFTLGAFYSLLFGELLGHVFGLDVTNLATSNIGGLLVALLLTFVLAGFAAGITGVLIERIAYRRLRTAPRLAPLITAIGVSFLIEGMMQASFGSGNVTTDKSKWITGQAFSLGGVSITWNALFVIVVALVMMFLLQSFVRYSRLGKAMRATAQDRDAALLSGININRTISATFFIGSALAAVGGVVYSIHYDEIQWNLGFRFGIIAFTSAVLGGIGNLMGAGVGGFLIGVIYVLGAALIGGEWADSTIFVMLIVVLVMRPSGLLGMRVPDRA